MGNPIETLKKAIQEFGARNLASVCVYDKGDRIDGILRYTTVWQLGTTSFRRMVRIRLEGVQNLRTEFRDISIIASDESHTMHLGRCGK
jgi:hypothetical protein